MSLEPESIRSLIARRRLASQHLFNASLGSATELVTALGAVQAQDYPAAKWAVAQRTTNGLDAAIEQELNEGKILRTHVLRPTWHFVGARDIRWMLALTAPRIKAAIAYSNRWFELDEATLRRSKRAIARALRDGKELTRAELAATLARAGVAHGTPQRLAHILMEAELDAVVCSGARRENQFTYALFDDRVPAGTPIGRDEALMKLASIYFATRGPATLSDFAWWSGLTVRDARQAIKLNDTVMRSDVLDDATYWFTDAAREAPARRKASPSVHLLPNYDEYVVAYKNRSAVGERLRTSGVEIPRDAIFANIVVVDGQIAGTWKRTFKKSSVLLHVQIRVSLTPREQRTLTSTIGKYENFIGMPVTAQSAT